MSAQTPAIDRKSAAAGEKDDDKIEDLMALLEKSLKDKDPEPLFNTPPLHQLELQIL